MRTATACYGDLQTLFSILFTPCVYMKLDRYVDEPEAHATHPRQIVIGQAGLDSRSLRLAALMLQSLHNGHGSCHPVVIELCRSGSDSREGSLSEAALAL